MIQQLNGYLDLLPCLFHSEHATKLTKVVQSFDDADLVSHILCMVPRNWQDQHKLMGGTVPQRVHKLLKCLSTSKRPSRPRRTMKSLKQVHQEVVPRRKGWSLLVTESLKSPAKKQSSAHYARSMGACRTPITLGTARNKIRMVLQKRRTHSATRAMEACHAIRKRTTCSCPQKSLSLKSPTGNSSVQVRNASAIMIATATTLMHPEVMGLVALGI